MTSIIPVQRLHFHLKRLALRGLKVAVIKQAESAALKAASDNRNELFARKLDRLYTKSTLIGEDFLTIDNASGIIESKEELGENEPSCLVCISEKPYENKTCEMAVVSVNFSSGEVAYSCFEDSLLRNKLENCLANLNPAEILLSVSATAETNKLIKCFNINQSIRIEKTPEQSFNHHFALDTVTKFYSYEKGSDSQDLQTVLALPSLVISCLSCLVSYLKPFKLDGILKNSTNIKPFSSSSHMTLNAATLRSLEVLKCSSKNAIGSLFQLINKAATKSGERLLKSWLCRPLRNLKEIEERLEVVTEMLFSDCCIYKAIKTMLKQLPDLERILCSVYYCKCSCKDFVKLLVTFLEIRNLLRGLQENIADEVQSGRLKLILTEIPKLLEDSEGFLLNINQEAAKDENKTDIFVDVSAFPSLSECKEEMCRIEKELNDLKPEISKTLRMMGIRFTTVAGQKYLIEVPNSNLKLVPSDWLKISSTKQCSRYRSPKIIKLLNALEQQEALMRNHAQDAWHQCLEEFSKGFAKCKQAITHLAELDCYFSLAEVAKREKFCKPRFDISENRTFKVCQGFHPVIMQALGDGHQFVANDIELKGENNCLVITGPNMGGKSTFVRQFAVIAVLAQMGSYVPANFATLPIFDGIYVRMGADDDLIHGKSTFMLEMSESSEILRNVTSNSLVILDELGRGTSTNDGAAIACATLEHLVSEVKCYTLFVTHYPSVTDLQVSYPYIISNVHMSYVLKEDGQDDEVESVTFLYSSISGKSKKSYGINVASLAGIPKEILLEAQEKSLMFELQEKIVRNMRKLMQILQI